MRKASRGNLSPRSGRSGPAGRWGDAPYQDSPTVPAFARGTALLPGHTGSRAVPESRGRPREVISLSGRDTRLQSPSASPAGVGGERRGYQVCASGHLGLQAANSGVREVPAVENRNPRAGGGAGPPLPPAISITHRLAARGRRASVTSPATASSRGRSEETPKSPLQIASSQRGHQHQGQGVTIAVVEGSGIMAGSEWGTLALSHTGKE